ncbi:site-specific DNA-methyltransferase [uncultured Algibacter sp.]|uniref:site-specific DNA-methyltransferase n=1 Tax=uncultured Algibacter sp. TaxID=298659 RepID=UPI0026243F93|nr:site-specific DNA-methyltransferase [uncultured Algibacter sp.]
MPTLNWIGKEKVINHHQDVPYKILEPQYTFSDGKESKKATSGNKIIHGDNLEALKSLLPEYEGKIKCIYIDPPYNTGNEGWVYNDNVNHPKLKKWLGQVVGKESEDLSRHDKWLCMMYPRLKLLHKLLANDGAIFISIDDNEQANLKLICDEIFGIGNFLTTFMWKRKKELSNDSKNISIQGEYILAYSKSKETQLLFEDLSKEYIEKSYKDKNDEFPLGKWRPVPITVSKGLSGGGYEYEIKTPSGDKHNRLWAYPEESYLKLIEQKRVYFGVNKKGIPQRVIYAHESKGQPTTNYWDNVITNKEGKKEIIQLFGGNDFNTPKPVLLICKILKISTNKNSIILDSFAGSGTTAHAVLNLNKQDGGNRKFILVEMEDYANTITAERVKKVINGYGEDKKVIEGTGGDFIYYELGEPLFKADKMLNEDVPLPKIQEYVWYTETKESFKAQEENYLLGTKHDTAYYFYYEKESLTTLDESYLRTLKTKAQQYIVYADLCLLDQKLMDKYHIVFKKIPRDITRF